MKRTAAPTMRRPLAAPTMFVVRSGFIRDGGNRKRCGALRSGARSCATVRHGPRRALVTEAAPAEHCSWRKVPRASLS